MKDLPTRRLLLELYSYEQLSRMWHRPVATIQRWVWELRRAGEPVYGTYAPRPDPRKGRRRWAPRQLLIRGDTAELIRDRFMRVRLLPLRRRRSSM